MASVNKVILIGNLGNDPEQRVTQSGRAVTNFRVATNERWTDQNGQTQEKTNWHSIVVWGKQAESCARYLSKGRPVYVEGKLETRSYEDKDGATRYVTEVIARDVVFLGGREGGGAGGDHFTNEPAAAPASSNSRRQQAPPPPPPADDYPDDDIPF